MSNSQDATALQMSFVITVNKEAHNNRHFHHDLFTTLNWATAQKVYVNRVEYDFIIS